MRVFILSVCITISVLAASSAEIKWIDPSLLEIEGRGWKNTNDQYVRFPDSVKDKVSDTAWDMSRDSAGICIRFVTDAPEVHVRWSVVRNEIDMPHMPATGVSGLDLYTRHSDGKWRFAGNGRPHKPDNNYTVFNIPRQNELVECLLYLPLYNGIKVLEMGIPTDKIIQSPEKRPIQSRKPIVFYGTSITQGGCASRPGMAYPAILGRWLDRPTINLGFSSSGTMDSPIGDVLAELNPAAYVIDCLWNIGDASQEEYDHRVLSLIKSIRIRHPRIPIIFVAQSLIDVSSHPTGMSLKQETAVKKIQKAANDRYLFVVPGIGLIGDDMEATVDGVHMTDLGMIRQSECLLPYLKKALRSH